MLRKIRTQHVRSCTQAAYAEAQDLQLDRKVEQTVELMKTPAAQYYRIENETGSFVGFFVMALGQLLQAYVRPHFQVPPAELEQLYAQARQARYAGSMNPDNLVTLNIL